MLDENPFYYITRQAMASGNWRVNYNTPLLRQFLESPEAGETDRKSLVICLAHLQRSKAWQLAGSSMLWEASSSSLISALKSAGVSEASAPVYSRTIRRYARFLQRSFEPLKEKVCGLIVEAAERSGRSRSPRTVLAEFRIYLQGMVECHSQELVKRAATAALAYVKATYDLSLHRPESVVLAGVLIELGRVSRSSSRDCDRPAATRRAELGGIDTPAPVLERPTHMAVRERSVLVNGCRLQRGPHR